MVTTDVGGTNAATLTADAVPPVSPDAARFHTLIIVEGVRTGDGRTFVENGLSWRDLPLPMMATDKTTWDHEDAVLVGNIDTIERRGTEIHGWGTYLSAPEGEAARLIGLIQRGELRGVSADIDDVESELLFAVLPGEDSENSDETDASETRETDEEGQEWVVVSGPEPQLRVLEGRVMGATVVPFPAFQEAYIDHESVTAAAIRPLSDFHLHGLVLVAAGATTEPMFQFPEIPPRVWFDVPENDEPTPLTILATGQVFGHIATWGTCHTGYRDACVEPPRSATNYARFHVGVCPTDDGGTVDSGRLTFATGHADTRYDMEATRSHYDNTGSVAADIVASDGVHGIWVAGAMRSTLSTAQVREVMASPPSGDWRKFGRSLELVGVLAVNVPGFNTPRSKVRKADGLVASLIVSRPVTFTTATSARRDPALVPTIERIASSIGRSGKQRTAQAHQKVHG